MPRSSMPSRFLAGDSVELSLVAAANEYPAADGYAVALTLTPLSGGTPESVSATGGATSWDIALGSTASAALAAGTHRWMIAATKSGNRTTIDYGDVEVLANPADSATDLRSAARIALDAIDAMLAGRASASELKFVFEDGRSIEHMPHSELLRLRSHYARRVAAEKRTSRGPARVQVRL